MVKRVDSGNVRNNVPSSPNAGNVQQREQGGRGPIDNGLTRNNEVQGTQQTQSPTPQDISQGNQLQQSSQPVQGTTLIPAGQTAESLFQPTQSTLQSPEPVSSMSPQAELAPQVEQEQQPVLGATLLSEGQTAESLFSNEPASIALNEPPTGTVVDSTSTITEATPITSDAIVDEAPVLPQPPTINGVPTDERTLSDPKPIRKVKEPTRQNLAKAKVTREERARRKDISRNVGNVSGPGNGLSGVLEGDTSLGLREISFGDQQFIQALRQPGSALINIINQYAPTADIDGMIVNDDTQGLYDILNNVFNNPNFEVQLLTMKHPTPSEADGHVRTIRMHNGDGVKIHPIALDMFNADLDGDAATVSLDITETQGAKTAMDFLVGTDNIVHIDDNFFGFTPWGSKEDVKAAIKSILSRIGLQNTRSIDSLSNAVYDATMGKNGGLESMARWVREIGARQGLESNKPLADYLSDRIISGIYEYNGNIRTAASNLYLESAVFPVESQLNENGIRNPEWDLDINPGSMPANFYDLMVELGAPIGQATKKSGKLANIHYRMAAAIGKSARPDQRIKIGPNEWINSNSWTDSATELIAKAMRGRVALGESYFSSASFLRTNTIQDTGAPRQYSGLQEFADAFAANYNYYSSALNAASVVIYTDGSVERTTDAEANINKKGPRWNHQDIAGPFKNVYGDYTMAELFGDHAPAGYRDMSLNEFIDQSRIRKLDSDTLLTDAFGPFITALQDLRTGTVQAFNDAFNEALKKNVGKIGQVLVRGEKHNRNYVAELNQLTDALYLLGREVFSYFKLDSIENFKSIDLGQRMIKAKTSQQLGGLVYEAIGRYRTDEIFGLASQIKQSVGVASEAKLNSKLEMKLDELASISDVWAALVRDYRDGGNAINDILLNDKLDKIDKERKLIELQQEKKIGGNLKLPYEVAYELYGNPKSPYDGSRQLSDFGIGESRRAFKASSDAIDSYVKKNYETILENVVEAENTYSEEQLQQFFTKVASDPKRLYQVSTAAHADALLVNMEPTYDSTEKSSQETAVDTFYNNVSTLVNGGVWSDLTICDDFYLGKMEYDRFCNWPVGIARILSDPSYSITVYDSFGETLINRETLTGGTDTASLWQYLRDNPRMAMLFRMNSLNSVLSDKKNTTYNVATATLSQTIGRVINQTDEQAANNRLYNELVDKPGFSAILAAMQNTKGIKARQLRNKVSKDVQDLLTNIRALAWQEQMDLDAYIEDFVDAQVSKMDSWFQGGEVDIDSGFPVDDGKEQIRNHLIQNLTRYALIARDLSLPAPSEAFNLDLKLNDSSTAWSYFNTVQVFSGAKTETSTGVNGAESQRNGLLPFFASYIPEACDSQVLTDIAIDDFRENWRNYERRKTDAGIVITETNIDQIIDMTDTGMIRIEVPESCTNEDGCPCTRHVMADPSTNLEFETQTSPLSRFMLDKRTLGSEGNNLKVKTLGDDGRDSISKFNVFEDYYDDIKYQVIETFDTQGMLAARRKLAELLYSQNVAMDYTSLNQDDFTNIAQQLIKEIPSEDGTSTIAILSVGQLNSIIKDAVDFSIREAGELTSDQIVDIALAAKRSYDPTQDIDIAGIADRVTVNAKGSITPAVIDERRSSLERNLQLVSELQAQLGVAYTDAQRSELNNQYKKLFSGYDSFLPKGYRFMGAVNNDIALYTQDPGPETAWVIHGSNKAETVKALRAAHESGVTVFFDAISKESREALLETGYDSELTEINGINCLPFFDILLNGPNTSGSKGSFDAGTYRYHPDNIVVYVEDTTNSFNLGDSEFQPLSSLTDRVVPIERGEFDFTIRDSFRVLADNHPGKELRVNMPLKPVIEYNIVNNENFGILIDLGFNPETNVKLKNEYELAIDRYIERFDETDEAGWLLDGEPGDVVGWITAEVTDDSGQVIEAWHPLRMFELNDQRRGPASFSIDNYGFDQNIKGDLSRGRFTVQWSHEGSLLGRNAKLFEAGYAADKFIVKSELPKYHPTRTLTNGINVDGFVSSESTIGRRLSYHRIQAMNSMFTLARLHNDIGYNFAESDGVFPNNPEIQEGLSSGTMRLGDWKTALAAGPIEFFSDGIENKIQMDAFMNGMAQKAIQAGVNPSIVFASHHNGVPTYQGFDYRVVFSSSLAFTDSLMQFFNFMDSSICPSSRKDDSLTGTLFNNRLQTLVPLTDADGNLYHSWQYVYAGMHFFDKHYSGFSTPGAKASTRSLPLDNTLMYGGRKLDPRKQNDYVNWALYDRPGNFVNNWLVDDDIEIEG